MTKIKSEFLILDILSKTERKKLQKLLEKDGPIPVVIKGRLTRVWGNHDGVSQEYEVAVDGVETAS